MEIEKTELDLYTRSEISLSTISVSGHRLPAWTDIKMCTEDCPIFNQCKAQKIDELCIVQKNYLGVVVKGAVKTLPKPVSEEVLQRIGLIMIPMYSDLFLFQLEKSALSKIMVGSGVNAKVHPIFKTIREIIQAIDKQWERIGLSKIAIKKLKNVDGDMVHGDSDYYDSISK